MEGKTEHRAQKDEGKEHDVAVDHHPQKHKGHNNHSKGHHAKGHKKHHHHHKKHHEEGDNYLPKDIKNIITTIRITTKKVITYHMIQHIIPMKTFTSEGLLLI